MARVCHFCGKGATIGHNVSYSKRRTRRVFLPNLHTTTLPNGKRVKLCSDCLSILKKKARTTKET